MPTSRSRQTHTNYPAYSSPLCARVRVFSPLLDPTCVIFNYIHMLARNRCKKTWSAHRCIFLTVISPKRRLCNPAGSFACNCHFRMKRCRQCRRRHPDTLCSRRDRRSILWSQHQSCSRRESYECSPDDLRCTGLQGCQRQPV